ncbi:hypothetical protein [Nitrosospira sp. NpAV]|nr:hypothetical protein [Nitrosospira sp. NpAV]
MKNLKPDISLDRGDDEKKNPGAGQKMQQNLPLRNSRYRSKYIPSL